MWHIAYTANIDKPPKERRVVYICEEAWGRITPSTQANINIFFANPSPDTCPDCLRLWKLRQQPFRRG